MLWLLTIAQKLIINANTSTKRKTPLRSKLITKDTFSHLRQIEKWDFSSSVISSFGCP
jgi:hypothetical protein